MTSTATLDAARRDWALYCDWCTSRDRQPLPATVAGIGDFLEQMGGSRSLQRRRATSIHTHAELLGHPIARGRGNPEADAAVVWHAALGDLGQLLAQIPRDKWPHGLARRRDAFVLVCASLGLTRHQIRHLDTSHITHGVAGRFRITQHAITPTTGPGESCPCCAVHDWLAALATTVGGGRGEAQRLLLAASWTDPHAHRCTLPLDDRWQRAPELVPAIDPHGWVDDTRPVSARTISHILRLRIQGPASIRLRPEPDYPPPPAADEALAHLSLGELLEELDQRVETITGQVEALLNHTTRRSTRTGDEETS